MLSIRDGAVAQAELLGDLESTQLMVGDLDSYALSPYRRAADGGDFWPVERLYQPSRARVEELLAIGPVAPEELAMGAGIGITTGNLPVGMAGGLALGLAISAKRRRKYEDHGKQI